MKLAFFKGSGTFFDRLIRRWTGGPYSHVELIFSDGVCYSSLPGVGVRMAVFADDATQWDVVNFPVSAEEEARCREWAEGSLWIDLEAGRKRRRGYDWLGIFLCQVLPLDTQDSSRYFCSEAVVLALQKAGWLRGYKASYFSPNALYRKLVDKG